MAVRTHSSQQRFPFNRKDQASSYSIVLYITWILIILWMIFLFYCWQFGLIDKQKLNTVIENVENEIINTEQNLLRGHHFPQFGGSTQLSPHEVLSGSGDHSALASDAQNSLYQHNEDDVHVIFSTDCTPYQDWQTLVLFHSARVVGQRGTVTRIASGCDDTKQQELTALYEKLYPDLPFRAHFTPDFKKDEKTNRKYDFYNKPWGLKHWLENAKPGVPDNAIIALLDPDMILIRPITPYVRSVPHLISRRIPPDEVFERITEGHPAAQTYGLGAPWTNDNHKHFNRGKICGEGSPCLIPDEKFGELHYAVGPPYVVHKQDFIKIAQSWTRLVPRVYEDYPFLLAEMYAYSMAAAHEKLPHLQLDNYMVSNVEAGGEGWEWVDSLDSVCIPPNEQGIYYPNDPMPTVIHFCQTYRGGDLMYTKRRVPKDIFKCDSPLLVEPTADLQNADYFYKKGEKKPAKDKKHAKRNAFMLCITNKAVNDALVDFKKKMCGPDDHVNLEKTLAL